MKFSATILSILLLGVLASAYGPYVSPQGQLPNVFLKANEVFNVDLSNYFEGYNLTFSTNSSNATVQGPLSLLSADKFGPAVFAGNQTFVSQTYPKDKSGNIDYAGYILYVTLDNYLYWANISNYTSVPNMVYGFQLTALRSVHCYGAAQIDSDLVIVDCSSQNVTTGTQLDWFFYVSLSQKTVIAQYNQSATANTTYSNVTGTAIRGVRVVDFGKGNRFIFRYVGSGAILNQTYQNDSYIEVYKAFVWAKPVAYTIISSANLGVNSFILAGFEILNNALFILNGAGTAHYIQNFANSFSANQTNTFNFPSSCNPIDFAVSIEYYKAVPQLTFLAYTNNLVWEINWTIPSAPVVIQNYTFGQDITILKADFSADYIFAQVNSSSLGAKIVTFRRGSTGFFQLYKSLAVSNIVSAIWWSLDRNYNNLYLWDANVTEVHNFHLQKQWLLFNSSIDNIGSVVVTATSSGSDGLAISFDSTFNFIVINETDFNVYPNTSIINVTLEYPSTYNLGLENTVIGPGINYTVGNSPPFKSYNFLSNSNLALTLPTGFQPKTITYHKITPNTSAPGTFNWFVQADGLVYNLVCLDGLNSATQSPSLTCTAVGNFTLADQVLRLVMNPQYITIINAKTPNTLDFYEPNFQKLPSVLLNESCADLVTLPSGDYLACSQTVAQKIILWNSSHPDAQIIINRTQISQKEYPNFTPSDLVVSATFPGYLFVKNGGGVMVLNLALIGDLGIVEVVSNFALPNVTAFDFIMNENTALFFMVNGSNTTLQEYSIGTDPTAPLFVKQYTRFFDYQFQAGATSHYSSSSTNRFFAVVQDGKNTPELVTFQARSTANSNYLNRFNLGWTAGAALLSGVHSSVVNAEYLLIGNGNGNLSAFVVYDKTLFSFGAYLNNTSSTTEMSSFQLNATSSLQNNQSLPLDFSINTYNSNPPVAPGKMANNTNALNFINFTTNKTSFVFNPTDFFSGAINNLQLTPQNVNESSKITLQTPVTAGNNAFNATFDFLDLAIIPQFIYAQGNKTLVQLDASNTSSVLNIIDMGVAMINPQYQKCTNLVADDSGLFTTSFCLDTLNNLGYLVTVSFLSGSPSTLPPILTSLTSVNSMKKIGDMIFLLENPNGQVANPGSKLHVYDFSSPGTPTYNNYLSGSIFNARSFQVGGFDIVNITDTYYRIYLADGRFGVRTVEFNVTSVQWVNPQSYNLFTDASFQNENIPYNALFLGLSVIQPVAANVTNDTYIALTTDVYNNYYVKLSFSTTGLSASLLAVYKRVTAAVNLPKITSVSNGYTYFAVSSYNNYTGEGLVTLFNATNSNNQATQVKSIPYPAASSGSNAFAFLNQGNAIKLWTYSSPSVSSNSNLKASNEGSLQEYQITPFYSINVDPKSNITSKYVNLTASNSQNSYTVSFNITYTNKPVEGSSRWWIWLVIIFGLLIVGGAIYAFIKYRNKKENDLDGSGDANAPLATNYA